MLIVMKKQGYLVVPEVILQFLKHSGAFMSSRFYTSKSWCNCFNNRYQFGRDLFRLLQYRKHLRRQKS